MIRAAIKHVTAHGTFLASTFSPAAFALALPTINCSSNLCAKQPIDLPNMVKRKAENQTKSDGKNAAKNLKRTKNTLSPEDTKARFRKGLFDETVLSEYTNEYATSTPYKHAVINQLVDDSLLRKVRDEIKDNVSFTPKETDIYKIHQSGDLANLDGLDDDALSKLPSLLALRDALYSETFRNYVSHITDCGPLSGRKTDMAINVYTPGCYLLCHDDVIGSRKVSYILYLTDPDTPWQPEWGGALRLFPVEDREGKDGEIAKTPLPDPVKVVPPAWNQLSFFAVQPGESFHDVEEVYHTTKEELEKQGGRIRMAISGWFHIPQIGEDGYVEGAEEKAAHKSGLMQLQGNPDQYDRPVAKPVEVEKESSNEDEENTFDESDLEFLLKYLAPTYLTPDTIENIADQFEEQFSITLSDILHPKFAAKIKEYVEAQEAKKLPEVSEEIEKAGAWKVARPPHKHRFLYLQPGETDAEESPIKELLEVLLPSRQFRLWLQMATRSTIEGYDLLARRFRHGKDYTLATGHDGKARLELNIGLTPTDGWGDVEEVDEDEEEEEEEEEEDPKGKGKGKATSNGSSKEKGKGKAKDLEQEQQVEEETVEVGGHEVYMAGDDDDDEDAAIYKSSEDDDNILFFQAAAWNKMALVLRDSGTLRFVKYVSHAAKGDRWDVSGSYEIEEQDEDPDAEELGEGAEDGEEGSDDDDEFEGFDD